MSCHALLLDYGLFWYEEVDDFLLHGDGERSLRCTHQSPVDADKRLTCLHHLHLARTIRMDALIVEEFATHKEIEALEELRHTGMVHYADVQHAVVRHGVRRLSVAGRVADAHRHDVALDVVMIDLYVHAIFQTLENHHYEGEHKRQRTRSEIVAGLTTEVHYGSYQSDVDAVKEVAAASLTLLIGISYASEDRKSVV